MIRDIKIRAVLSGFVVEVGCQTVVFNEICDLTDALYEYLEDPDATEKLFTLLPNAKHTMRLPGTLGKPATEAQYAAVSKEWADRHTRDALLYAGATSPCATGGAPYTTR